MWEQDMCRVTATCLVRVFVKLGHLAQEWPSWTQEKNVLTRGFLTQCWIIFMITQPKKKRKKGKSITYLVTIAHMH